MKKDFGSSVGTGTGTGTYNLFGIDLKPFIATLFLVTLVIAFFQIPHPYNPSLFLSPSTKSSLSCPKPENLTTTTLRVSKTNSIPVLKEKIATISASKAIASDPNKREFKAYGNAAALFVQMSAYRGGPYTFAIMGLASKPIHVYGTPWYKCEWVPNSNSSNTIRAKAYKMLPDWGYGRVYTTVVVNCTFSEIPNHDNNGGKLILYAYYSKSPRRYEKFVVLEEAPGSYNESKFKPPFPYEYLYCGSSLYGNLSASRIREWIAYHVHFFGPRSHFVLHDAGGVTPAVRAAIDPWIRAGRVTLQDIRSQAEFDAYYYNQFVVVNDCLHRYRHAANWTFFFDVDEYIYLPDGRSLESVLAELLPYTQFTIEQNPMSSKLCVLDPKEDYANEWGFEKLVYRDSITGIRRDRKYAIQAQNAYATGIHMSENVIGNTTHKTEHLIRYYHYHNSINVLGEPCREFKPIPPNGKPTWFEKIPFVYDDNMKKVAPTIKQFEEKMIGPVRLPPQI
ncbi:hypothetical protein LUZ62_023303 [Rhynchospora pubera]|uniref:Glycosyltransferase family 92 protein n=1 Tax=Rhynchospora pubera TaxID=906938 RepID=A0AAV8H7J6_9POAL|nr:hypothetical protein LUZ62_013736 [Rhynchospora pubera]KAJ4747899.1 hypothetical protein LUZ62_082304 [Rhynchospora pubera]KAJ4810737.1 hypothetical protein LUZ62_023303 [Rhynchospora pubera]